MGCCGGKKEKYITPEKPKDETAEGATSSTPAPPEPATASDTKIEPEKTDTGPTDGKTKDETKGEKKPDDQAEEKGNKEEELPMVSNANEGDEIVNSSELERVAGNRKSEKKVSFAERRLSQDRRPSSEHMSSQELQAEWDAENPAAELPAWLKHGLGAQDDKDGGSSGFGSDIS